MRKVGRVTLRVIAPCLGTTVLTASGGGALCAVVVAERPQPARAASPMTPDTTAPARIRTRLIFMREKFRFGSLMFTPLRRRGCPRRRGPAMAKGGARDLERAQTRRGAPARSPA